MTNEEFMRLLLDKIDVMIALQLTIIKTENVSPLRDRIFQLAELGIGPAEIGRFVGRKANYVSAVLGTRKSKRKDDVDV